jgi:hypothetical protein
LQYLLYYGRQAAFKRLPLRVGVEEERVKASRGVDLSAIRFDAQITLASVIRSTASAVSCCFSAARPSLIAAEHQDSQAENPGTSPDRRS